MDRSLGDKKIFEFLRAIVKAIINLTHPVFLLELGKASSQDTSHRELHFDRPVSEHSILRVASREKSKGRRCYDDTVSGSHQTVR